MKKVYKPLCDHVPPWAIPLITYLALTDPDFLLYSQWTISQQERKRLQSKNILESEMESISRAAKTKFTVLLDSGSILCQLSHVNPQDITSHIIHWVI